MESILKHMETQGRDVIFTSNPTPKSTWKPAKIPQKQTNFSNKSQTVSASHWVPYALFPYVKNGKNQLIELENQCLKRSNSTKVYSSAFNQT